MKFFLFLLKKLFRRKTKIRRFNNETAVEAFRHNGKAYYHFTDSFKIPAGRAMAALAIYTEMQMRCTKDYLVKHTRAMEIILSDPKKINIGAMAIMNKNLQERLALVPFPDHIYKLASVTFFDETENISSYDFKYNEAKIEEWKQSPELMDFFLSQQLSDLIPFSSMSDPNAKMYFPVSEQIDRMHQQTILDILSSKS